MSTAEEKLIEILVFLQRDIDKTMIVNVATDASAAIIMTFFLA